MTTTCIMLSRFKKPLSFQAFCSNLVASVHSKHNVHSINWPCHYKTLSSTSNSYQTISRGPFEVGKVFRGHSGQSYQIQEVLYKKSKSLSYVYRASAEGENYIIKNCDNGEFESCQELQKPLASCASLRTIIDTVPDFELFVYHFLKDNLLQFCQRALSEEIRKDILESALVGLVALHDRSIFHRDIKPNNILLDYEETDGKILRVENIRIADLEDAFILAPKTAVKGGKSGNQYWRSSESWCKGLQNFSSDVFSMGIVAIYIMSKQMVFHDGLKHEDLVDGEAWNEIMLRHILYFWDKDDYLAFLDHIGEDNQYFDRIVDMINAVFEGPVRSNPLWCHHNAEFQDLVLKMTRLDPMKRISAREALEHPFFAVSKET